MSLEKQSGREAHLKLLVLLVLLVLRFGSGHGGDSGLDYPLRSRFRELVQQTIVSGALGSHHLAAAAFAVGVDFKDSLRKQGYA